MTRSSPAAASRRLPALVRLLRDRRGVSTIEFAFIVPILILFFMGTAELGAAVTAQRKLMNTTFTVGDLVTQQSSINAADLTDIFQVANTLIPAQMQGNLTIRVMSVGVSAQGTATVLWCKTNVAVAGNLACPAANATLPNFPMGLLPTATSTVIETDASNHYTSIMASLIPNGITMTTSNYINPRLQGPISYTN